MRARAASPRCCSSEGPLHVTALDVGHDQLVHSIATDPRVRDLPGTNIRDVDAAALGGAFDLVVSDLSFISLAHRPARHAHRSSPTTVTSSCSSSRSSRSAASGSAAPASSPRRTSAAASCATWPHVVAEQGLHLHGATASPIAGGDGNREFLFWLAPRPVPGASVTAVDDMLEAVDLEGAP